LLVLILVIYIIILFVIWGFFIVARMHTMKFKHFSNHIAPATNILTIFLATLSILWFIFIFYLFWWKQDNYEIKISNSQIENTKQNNKSHNLEKEIIGDDYY